MYIACVMCVCVTFWWLELALGNHWCSMMSAHRGSSAVYVLGDERTCSYTVREGECVATHQWHSAAVTLRVVLMPQITPRISYVHEIVIDIKFQAPMFRNTPTPAYDVAVSIDSDAELRRRERQTIIVYYLDHRAEGPLLRNGVLLRYINMNWIELNEDNVP